jgi:hypothetical protein
MKKTPRRLAFDERALALSRLETFVLSRVDGRLSASEIARVTGLAAPQVEQIIGRLEARGAIALDEAVEAGGVEYGPSRGGPLADERIAEDVPAGGRGAGDEPLPEAGGVAEARSTLEALDADAGDDFAVPVARSQTSKGPVSSSWRMTAAHASPPPAAPLEAALDAGPPPALSPSESDVTDPHDGDPVEVQNYRKLYETELRHLPSAERITKARVESGPVLYALAFDQEPQVIKGLLENDRMSLDHARLIATNHRNPVGLEALCARVSLLQDARVQRALLRNIQLTETLLRRILNPKRLLEVYKASLDRDVPDRTRAGARALLKTKFAVASSEEKFEIIWTTEGRVLQLLIGQTLDQKTTAIFCGRNFASVMLIQSFARWPATPPGILAHMLRQPLVQRQAHLKNIILQHPNVPSDAKRKF